MAHTFANIRCTLMLYYVVSKTFKGQQFLNLLLRNFAEQRELGSQFPLVFNSKSGSTVAVMISWGTKSLPPPRFSFIDLDIELISWSQTSLR